MDRIVTVLKTLGHQERLRILALLAEGELTVSELVEIMGLSQPRITQYINSLENAGIIERMKEGSWVFSRIARSNAAIFAIVTTVLANLKTTDRQLVQDYERLSAIQNRRAKAVDAFFADVANDRGQLGDEYLPKEKIDAEIVSLIGDSEIDYMVDLGTGTGRVLSLLAGLIKRGVGIDNNSDMLKVARHKLSGGDLKHISVQQGNLSRTAIERSTVDLVTIHQVLHYMHEPQEAIDEAARILNDNGRLLIVDYAVHDREEFREQFAHRRLGFSDFDMQIWLNASGFDDITIKTISNRQGYPDVKIWLARRSVHQPDRNFGS